MFVHIRSLLNTPVDCINVVGTGAITIISVLDVLRYATYGSLLPVLTIAFVDLCSILLCVLTVMTHCSPTLILVVGINLALGDFMNNRGTAMDNIAFFIIAGIAFLAACMGSLAMAKGHTKIDLVACRKILAVLIVLCVTAATLWQTCMTLARDKTQAGPSIWSVPSEFESTSNHPGTVRPLRYRTHAYSSDGREVQKTAYVYLPFKYDRHKSYNILYLMHGTGDSASYWLKKHPENVHMVDQLIDHRIIKPMIIVTPSFYVQNDAKDHLDTLTYSFAKELRRDLMPAVESHYSTYAKKIDDQGFRASRNHRAFAGLSRGAVTTYHSAIEQNLDYYSWFGTFSGSRTSAHEFKTTACAYPFSTYPIHYLYASSGSFDFALAGQLNDYRNLLKVDNRLEPGKNTRFDVFPMRYHSSGNWHLALYNFLQCIFDN